VPEVANDLLFKDRVPEAAARQLATVLAWLTECQLATLQDLRQVKSTPKSKLARQQQICDRAVAQCHELGVAPWGLRGERCLHLTEQLSKLRAETDTNNHRN